MFNERVVYTDRLLFLTLFLIAIFKTLTIILPHMSRGGGGGGEGRGRTKFHDHYFVPEIIEKKLFDLKVYQYEEIMLIKFRISLNL